MRTGAADCLDHLRDKRELRLAGDGIGPAEQRGAWRAYARGDADVPARDRHRGSGHPLAPATPPDMRVRIGRFRGLRKTIEESRKPKRVEVGERKRDGQGRAVRHPPGTVRTTRRLCSECLTNPALT